MSDIMTPIPFEGLMDWLLAEKKQHGTVFGVRKLFHAEKQKELPMFREKLETPFGPAAGPHTQLAQNIIAAYAGGSRFFELKTVQTLDGEDLPVSKPCIWAKDEGYNVEWSTELRVPEAMEEYIKAWFALKLIAKEFGMGDPDGFIFNMSVGYDFDGITSPKIDAFIEGLRDTESTAIWSECKAVAKKLSLSHVDEAYIDGISPKVCDSITLSTLHGCPPKEIERIASYLIKEKGLNTYIKCNPTLLGYEYARKTLDDLGFDYIAFDDHHFKNDLQYEDAIPMLKRLQEAANGKGVDFGVKLTNTFPVQIAHKELPGEEMYMSGRSLFPLTISVAQKLSAEFGGKLRMSFSGGGDAFNIAQLFDAGIWPITVATTLLKAGGYNRLKQMADALYACDYVAWGGVDNRKLEELKRFALTDELYRKPIKPVPERKFDTRVPFLDCFTAPCSHGCPINQDIPAYVGLVGEGKYLDALRVITQKNPLPHITGTICPHHCGDKCTRNFYEEPVNIRETKLTAAQKAFDGLLAEAQPAAKNGKRAAVIGGGAAGMAAAFFLAREGVDVTLFEKNKELGGIVRYVIPEFRIAADSIERDAQLLQKMGVTIKTGCEAPHVNDLIAEYGNVVLAVGAYKPGNVRLTSGEAVNVLDFLGKFRAGEKQNLGKNVVVVGGGNTAMDAARAAKRVPGVENVAIAYRRTKRYMPADEEELQLAVGDGVQFCELLAPTCIEGSELCCCVMELGEPDESGRRSPVKTDGEYRISADTVIAAVGESVDDAFLRACGVEADDRGRARVDQNLMTSIENVYIAGDANRGPATVVEAIADAQLIADAILGQAKISGVIMKTDEDPREKKGILVRACDAECEGKRCLNCDIVCENCVDVCPNRANASLLVDGRPQIVHIDKLCNECGNCEAFCPYASAPYLDKFTLFANESDFENSKNKGFVILDGEYRIRIGEKEYVTDGSGLAPDLLKLMRTAAEEYRYLV